MKVLLQLLLMSLFVVLATACSPAASNSPIMATPGAENVPAAHTGPARPKFIDSFADW
ncbi:MAG TPA: hypothetical protein VKY59_21605 [Spirillospora sp.]|nr:hypothetical protein [Spirillospora sp.]